MEEEEGKIEANDRWNRKKQKKEKEAQGKEGRDMSNDTPRSGTRNEDCRTGRKGGKK